MAYVNAYGCKLEDVTAERVGAHEKLLNGMSPFAGGPTRAKLERAKSLGTGLQKVVVYRAMEETQCAFLKKPPDIGAAAAAAAAASDDTSEFVLIECDCEDFFQSGTTICACTLAVTASKYAGSSPHIDLDMLLESTAATRRAPGRPRKNAPGNCYGSSSSSSSSSSSNSSSSSSSSSHSSAHYFEMNLRGKGGCFYHKWRVVVSFGEEVCVGKIVSYRDDYHEERKPYTTKTPSRACGSVSSRVTTKAITRSTTPRTCRCT